VSSLSEYYFQFSTTTILLVTLSNPLLHYLISVGPSLVDGLKAIVILPSVFGTNKSSAWKQLVIISDYFMYVTNKLFYF
jgi:hypothetical protein